MKNAFFFATFAGMLNIRRILRIQEVIIEKKEMNNISSSLTDVALVLQVRSSGQGELSLKQLPALITHIILCAEPNNVNSEW